MSFFYSTLRRGTNIDKIVKGKFSKLSQEDIIVSGSNFLELFRQKENGKFFSMTSMDLGCSIFSLFAFSLNEKKLSFLFLFDFLGRATILRWKNSQKFSIVSYKNLKDYKRKENFEGLFSSINQKSLICMICGIDQIKYGLIIKKSNNPSFFEQVFEIKQNSTICFSVSSLENEEESLFGCLETSYNKPYDKYLVFYNLNLVENSVKRLVFSRIDPSSYLLIPIPQGYFRVKGVLLCSRGFLTFVDYEKKKIKKKSLPWEKINSDTKHPLISCFDFFTGKTKLLLLMVTEEGCILKITFNLQNFLSKETLNKLDVSYLCTLPGRAKTIKILKSGFLFVIAEEGNHLQFHFKNLGGRGGVLYYYPEIRTQNLFLVDQLGSFSPVISVKTKNLFKKGRNRLILLCGSKSRSSIRILEKSSGIDLIRKKKLKKKPLGLYLIKNDLIFIQLILSFKDSTISFSLNRNIQEINNNGLIFDYSSFLIQFFLSVEGVIQTTYKKIRLIKYNGLKRKIIEWKPLHGIGISNSTVIETNEFLIILLLSNSTAAIIKFENNVGFLEVGRTALKIPYSNFMFGISFERKQKISNLRLFIFLNKKEKTARSYLIKKNFSLSLANIQLLPWCPESARLIVIDRKINLISTLNNGLVIQSQMNSNNARIESLRIIKICSSPLFISDQDLGSKILIFGKKIWKFKFFLNQEPDYKCFYNNSFDMIEAIGQLIILVRKKNLKILLGKKIHSKFDLFLKTSFGFTPIDLYVFPTNKRTKTTMIFHSDNFSGVLDHQMNLYDEFPSKKKRIQMIKKKEGNWVSGFSFLTFNKSETPRKLSKKIQETFFICGANMNRSIVDIYQIQSLKKKTQLILICFKNFPRLTDKTQPFTLIEEQTSFSISLGIFIIGKTSKFITKEGGRVIKKITASFVFEKSFRILNDCYPIGIIKNLLFGRRMILCKSGMISFLEIKKKNFKIVTQLNCPSYSLCNVSIIGNRVFLFDPGEGMKLFAYSWKFKNFFLIGEASQLKSITFSKLLDSFSLILVNEVGILFFLRINENKEKKKKNQIFVTFSILSFFEIGNQFRGFFNFLIPECSKEAVLFLITLDGTIFEIFSIEKKKETFFSFFSLFFFKKFKNINDEFFIHSDWICSKHRKNAFPKKFLERFKKLIK